MALGAVIGPFVWGQGGARLTPEEIAQQRKVLDALVGKSDTSPVGHWTQGMARIVDALGNVAQDRKLSAAEEKNKEDAARISKSLTDYASGLFGSPAPTPSTAPVTPVQSAPLDPISARVADAHALTAQPDMTAYQNAIASIESAGSGDYSAIGPTNDKLGRALGRYQIMEANIGPWSQEALGRAVTADEFLANPQLQDQIFNHRFGQYVNQFGPEGAAQAWFAGPGGVGKTGRSDVLGTTVGEYGQRFTSALGQPTVAQALSAPQQQPVQVAQAGGINPAIIEALSSPYADEGTKRIAGLLLQQQMDQQQAARQQQASRDNWLFQQQYQEQAQARDPLRQAQIEKLQREAATGGESFFGNPIAVQNPDGSVAYGQIGNKGTFRPIQLGEGQTFAPPTKTVNTGTESILMDQAGNVISRTPMQNRQEASEKAMGAAEGKSRAETQSEYDSITSKMPGLYGVVGRLDKLANEATYTMAGQAIDWGRNQLGLSPRDAAVARAEYTAVVDNQILPLLRDTFGAQFTAEEGQRLARTLGDPDKSPTEKQALLRAFIQQKERDISGLATRLGKEAPAPQSGTIETDIPGVTIRRKN